MTVREIGYLISHVGAGSMAIFGSSLRSWRGTFLLLGHGFWFLFSGSASFCSLRFSGFRFKLGQVWARPKLFYSLKAFIGPF